ncbi:MAG: hypothetical protein ABIN67_14220 [Ferruginibacter sp.]
MKRKIFLWMIAAVSFNHLSSQQVFTEKNTAASFPIVATNNTAAFYLAATILLL